MVGAVKSGNLKKLSVQHENENSKHDEEPKHEIVEETVQTSKPNPSSSNGASKEIKIEHSLVISPKHSDIEHILIPKEKTKKQYSCCVII